MKRPPLLTFLCLLGKTLRGLLSQPPGRASSVTLRPALAQEELASAKGARLPSWPLQADLDLHRCCHAHDCCYGRLEKLGCEPKMERYLFSATRHSIFCAGRTSCQRRTCECDKKAALCFRRNLGTYDRKYAHYPNKLCTGPTPPC
ncbi:hypothetical protein K5549_005943 [Capra hircus]|nr:hypothetical protein K5549_005943 [Capra hircus]